MCVSLDTGSPVPFDVRRRWALIAAAVACAAGTAINLRAEHPDASVIPWPIGAGARYHPDAVSVEARASCAAPAIRGLVHLELFARRQVVIVPAAIGVRGHGCIAGTATVRPTGVIGVSAGSHSLGDFFATWGQPLSNTRLLSWRGQVLAFVDGHRFHGDVRAIPLKDGEQIVLEVGGALAPHPAFLFSQRERTAFDGLSG